MSKHLVQVESSTANTKPLDSNKTGSPMVVTLGQQYNIGERPTVILYTYIKRHAGTPEKQHETKSNYLISHNTVQHHTVRSQVVVNSIR